MDNPSVLPDPQNILILFFFQNYFRNLATARRGIIATTAWWRHLLTRTKIKTAVKWRFYLKAKR
jgi:hypothetical protein